MQTQKVEIPSIKNPIAPSPGFAKKLLADFKLDRVGLCEFGCRYYSSNHGNYLPINRKRFAALTKSDARHFRGMKGILLQSPSAADGKSKNPHIAAMQ